jgi:Cu-Zn family superoxide dismutase
MNRYDPLNRSFPLPAILSQRPDAAAVVLGSEAYPGLHGHVCFYQTSLGVLVSAEVAGLPITPGECNDRIFGFHIHEGASCQGEPSSPFSAAGAHYNPDGCAHPFHAGDLPPLFGNDGLAVSVFLTDRFTVDELIERTVVIHDRRDDFTTDPSGDAGTRIACGVIRRRVPIF